MKQIINLIKEHKGDFTLEEINEIEDLLLSGVIL